MRDILTSVPAVLVVGAIGALRPWRVAPLQMVFGAAVLGIVGRRLVAAFGI